MSDRANVRIFWDEGEPTNLECVELYNPLKDNLIEFKRGNHIWSFNFDKIKYMCWYYSSEQTKKGENDG